MHRDSDMKRTEPLPEDGIRQRGIEADSNVTARYKTGAGAPQDNVESGGDGHAIVTASRGQGAPMAGNVFDAFISHRRVDGAKVAEWLCNQLRYYKLPGKLRDAERPRLEVYLDTKYARATVDFWTHNILPALRGSRFLILVATPACLVPGDDGSTNWVERELRAFPHDRKIIVARGAGDLRGPLPEATAQRVLLPHVVDLRKAAHWCTRLMYGATLRKELLAIVAALHGIPDAKMPLLHQEDRRRRRRWQSLLGVVTLGVVAGTVWARSAVHTARRERESEHWEGIERRHVTDGRYDLAEYAIARELAAGSVAPDLGARYRAYRQRRTIQWRGERTLDAGETAVGATGVDGAPCAIVAGDNTVELMCAGSKTQRAACRSRGPISSCHTGKVIVGCGHEVIALGNTAPLRHDVGGEVTAVTCTPDSVRIAIADTPPAIETLAAATLAPRGAARVLGGKQRWSDTGLCGTDMAYASTIAGSSRHPMIARVTDGGAVKQEAALSPSEVATLTVRANDDCNRFLVAYSKYADYAPTASLPIEQLIYDWETTREWQLPTRLRKVLSMSGMWAAYLTDGSALGVVRPTDVVRRDVDFKLVANDVADVAVVDANTTASLEQTAIVVRAAGEIVSRYPVRVADPHRVQAGDGVIVVEGASTIELWAPLAPPTTDEIPSPETLARELRLSDSDVAE